MLYQIRRKVRFNFNPLKRGVDTYAYVQRAKTLINH